MRGVRAIATRRDALAGNSYLALHLLLGLVVAAAAAMFVGIAEEIAAGEKLAAFDRAFARALRETTTPGLERFFLTVSWFGTREVLTAATAGVAIVLLAERRPALAALWISAQAGGGLLTVLLKSIFERTRPDVPAAFGTASGWSFPSGHVMGTFIFCGVGAYLLLHRLRSPTAVYAVLSASVIWCAVMGFSRLYLGVHFATDVVAGLVAGSAWVAVCVSGLHIALHRNEGRSGRRAGSAREPR
jgi:undecaprenyl-diphosphatase